LRFDIFLLGNDFVDAAHNLTPWVGDDVEEKIQSWEPTTIVTSRTRLAWGGASD
jgi:hypothetical protein